MQSLIRTPVWGDGVDRRSGLFDSRRLTRIEGGHDQQRHNQLGEENEIDHGIKGRQGPCVRSVTSISAKPTAMIRSCAKDQGDLAAAQRKKARAARRSCLGGFWPQGG